MTLPPAPPPLDPADPGGVPPEPPPSAAAAAPQHTPPRPRSEALKAELAALEATMPLLGERRARAGG